jgi:Methyltransferase domain
MEGDDHISEGLDLDQLASGVKDRIGFWTAFLVKTRARSVAEIGVFRGVFAEAVLRSCPDVERYYMVDPWRHLDDWNKPANQSSEAFDDIMAEAMDRTAFAEERRIVLRGRTIEVIEQIPDHDLDFAYIDGDHSLRGATLDLQMVLPKIRPDGWIGGDDFVPTVWQHAERFEPTFVFPYAVYFSEAIRGRIHAVGFNQFLIRVPGTAAEVPGFVDHTGRYGSITVASALRRDPTWLRTLRAAVPRSWRPAIGGAVHRMQRLIRRSPSAR